MSNFINFIVNPIAGSGKTLKMLPALQDLCKSKNIDHRINMTEKPGHATYLAEQASQCEATLVVVGGDGTLLEVANGLIGKKCNLGIIPTGTGNDLCRSLNISENIADALETIQKGYTKDINVGMINGNCFLNVSSIGYDAEIARDLYKYQRLIPGKAAYYVAALLKCMTKTNKKIKLNLDGNKIERDVLLVAAANGKYYGGGMKVNPNGDLSDDLLDVIIINKIAGYRIPFLLLKFIKGEHLDMSFVESFKCRKVEIEGVDEPLCINADGETGMADNATMEILNDKIKIFCPK